VNSTRTLIFVLCAKYGFVTETVRAKLLEIAAAQFEFAYSSGGKTVQSGSIGGESINFAIPGVFDQAALAELCRQARKEIKDLTDSELEDYCDYEEAPVVNLSIRIQP